MTLSAATTRQLHRVDDPSGVLKLLKITYPTWATPVCLVDDTRDLVTLGDTYVQSQFTVQLPNDKTKEMPRSRLQMVNVGRDLTSVFETLPPGATLTATLRLVSRATPGVVDWEFTAPMTGIHTDSMKVTASLSWDDVMRRNAVALRFDPVTAPAIFAD